MTPTRWSIGEHQPASVEWRIRTRLVSAYGQDQTVSDVYAGTRGHIYRVTTNGNRLGVQHSRLCAWAEAAAGLPGTDLDARGFGMATEDVGRIARGLTPLYV